MGQTTVGETENEGTLITENEQLSGVGQHFDKPKQKNKLQAKGDGSPIATPDDKKT